MSKSKDAIERIKAVLGLTNYGFSSYKNNEGVEFMVEGDELELEMAIYVVTPEGNLPAPEGEFEFVDGTKVSISEEGKISKISYAEVKEEEKLEEEVEEKIEVEATEEEKKEDETKMAEATLVDGVIVANDEVEFEVGQDLFVVTDEGRVVAPDGEHETTDGLIVVVVEGKITEIKEKEEVVVEEEVSPSIDEVVSTFTTAIEVLKNEIDNLKTSNENLSAKFSKFSNQPAGERVFNKASFTDELIAHKSDKLELLKKIRSSK